MVSTHLKNISQIGSFPQVGVNIKNIWNHHLDQEHYTPHVHPKVARLQNFHKISGMAMNTSWWCSCFGDDDFQKFSGSQAATIGWFFNPGIAEGLGPAPKGTCNLSQGVSQRTLETHQKANGKNGWENACVYYIYIIIYICTYIYDVCLHLRLVFTKSNIHPDFLKKFPCW